MHSSLILDSVFDPPIHQMGFAKHRKAWTPRTAPEGNTQLLKYFMHLSLGSNTLIQAKSLPALLSPTCLYTLVGLVVFCATAVKRLSFACHLKAIAEGSW